MSMEKEVALFIDENRGLNLVALALALVSQLACRLKRLVGDLSPVIVDFEPLCNSHGLCRRRQLWTLERRVANATNPR